LAYNLLLSSFLCKCYITSVAATALCNNLPS